MKYCRMCGNQLPDEALYCDQCGSSQNNMEQQYGSSYQKVSQEQIGDTSSYQFPQDQTVGMPYQQIPQEQLSGRQYQQMSNESAMPERPDKKRRKKKVLFFTITSLLITAVAVVLVLILVNLGNKAYFVIHGEKYYITAEEGVKDLQNAENGFRWDQKNGRKTSYRKVLADGSIVTDGPKSGENLDGTEVVLGTSSFYYRFVNDVTGSEYNENDTRLHFMEFSIVGSNGKILLEDFFPQISDKEGNLFTFDLGYPNDDLKFEAAYIADGKIISTDFADEEYEKLLMAWNKYSNQMELSDAMNRARKNGGFYYDPLFDWCTDRDYLCFLRNNGFFALSDRSRDWEKEIQNKGKCRMSLTRCKLMGMVKSGEIQSFVEIQRYSKPDNYIQVMIYANDENLKKILNNYKLPVEWWENAF